MRGVGHVTYFSNVIPTAGIHYKAPLNLSVMACHSLEDTGGPCMPVREFNLIACPLVQSS